MAKTNEKILSFGLNCKNTDAELLLLSPYEVFEKITSPAMGALVSYTQNLRSVLRYSKERYRIMKTSLPFFSCSVFEPPRRGLKNFKMSHGLIIDLDFGSEISEDLLSKLKADDQIVMGYTSPSRMGLKLLFLFDNPISDASKYTRFYKKFTTEFGLKYHLADSLDTKNSDVSRISFICHDSMAWLKTEYTSVEVPLNILTLEPEEDIFNQKTVENQDGLSNAAYRQILKLLDVKPNQPKSEYASVQEISEILSNLRTELETYNIFVKEEENLPYGIKLRVLREGKRGEINIYHGKQGYSVVTSARKGTDRELNDVSKHIVERFFNTI